MKFHIPPYYHNCAESDRNKLKKRLFSDIEALPLSGEEKIFTILDRPSWIPKKNFNING